MNIKSLRTFLAILSVAFILFLQSCGSKKDLATSGNNLTIEQQYAQLTSSISDWTSVDVPFSLSLTKPQRISLSGRARFVQGEAIDLSLKMLGIEVARIVIRTDSVFALYRIDRVFIAENIRSLTKIMPSSIANLQDLFLGRPFLIGGASLSQNDKIKVDLSTELSVMTIVPKKQSSEFTYGFVAGTNQTTFLTRFAAIAPSVPIEILVDYSPYNGATPAGVLAESTSLNIESGKTSVIAKMNWKWNNAKWNSTSAITWQIPSGYRKIPAAQLLKSLDK
ncbi:MAG: DUF4292 domain-containing protein [Muribaculum sp.]|nr:DUF4292 domain-containing protein [Muribaculaceae bacterium]MCM1081000.1 DUF4292 domain-containing protein [Muribaculum sp.]